VRLYLLFTFIYGVNFSIYFLFFNLYILSLGYEPSFLGLLVALPSIVVTIVAIPAGFLGDRIGYKRALLLGMILMLVSIAGIVCFHKPAGLILFGILFGLGNSLVWVINAPFMAANSSEEERTHLFSVQFAMNTFSGFFGFLIGGSLPVLFANFLGVEAEGSMAYQATMLTCVGLILIAILPLLTIRAQDGRVGERLRLKSAFQRPTLLTKLLLPQLIISFGAGILIPFLNVFFKQRFAIPDTLLGTIFAGQSIAIALATLAGPPLAERLGKIRAVVFTQLVSIPFLLLLGYSSFFTLAAVGFLVRAGLMNMGSPLYLAFAMEQVEEKRRAAVNGLLTMSWSSGWAMSNWVSGQLQQGPGFGIIFAITCTCYLFVSVLIYLFFGGIDRPRSSLRKEEIKSEYRWE
jgi:MFS family permease